MIIRIVADQNAVLAIDEIEIAVAALDPVIADDRARRAVFQGVAVRPGTQRAETVVLNVMPIAAV